MLHHGSVGASWEYNKRNLTLTLTFNVPLPSIFYHNKIFVFIMFTALSFLQLTHGLFLIWGTSWTLWKSCFSIYEYIYILKIYFRQNKSYKKRAFFFRELFFFNFELAILIWAKSTRFMSLKLCMGLSIVDSALFLLNFRFLFNKQKYGLFDFKTS